MNKNKNSQAQDQALDDVDRLFARLGSQGADAYRDFSPGKLPAREKVAPADATAAETLTAPDVAPAAAPDALPSPPPAPPILASIRPLRADPAPAQRLVAVAAPDSPLGDLFQRLLRADAAPAAAGPLRRMFSR
ncbi:MAG TPA: hypothetical protein VM687_15830 [Stenotrophomonas sp.]|nr:hypothetical protein [Stenotrophomonas sp.]